MCNSFLNICKASWKNLVEIVWWELHENLIFFQKDGYPFCDKTVLAFLEYFWLVRRLVHALLLFKFFRSFDKMINVAKAKLFLNMVDPINFLDTFWKADRSLKLSSSITRIWRKCNESFGSTAEEATHSQN